MSSPPRQPPSRGRAFGAVVPEGFEAWRPALEPELERPRPRPHRTTVRAPARPAWSRIPDHELEEVARQAAERRRARTAARQRFLGRHRVSGPRPAPALEALRGVGRTTKVAAASLALITAVLVGLFALPWLKVQRVEVEGTSVVPRAELLRDAGARLGQSTLLLNAAEMSRDLLSQPWVRSATVRVSWPGTLVLAVSPLPPVMRYQQGAAQQLLAASGAALGDGRAGGGGAALPLLVDQRHLAWAAAGSVVLPARLTQALVQLTRVFPAAYGVAVTRYVLAADGALEIRSSAGWTADLGLTVTSAQVSSIGKKLEALRALAAQVDLKTAGIKEIYLEDPRQVVVSY